MVRLGMMGMGKLGLPVALALESRGHDVHGYDVMRDPYHFLEDRRIPYQEKDLQPLLDQHQVTMHNQLINMVREVEIVFVPIQTPHYPLYDGTYPMVDSREDFDYAWLLNGLRRLSEVAAELKRRVTVAVISTCLPGTFERELRPHIGPWLDYVYTPQFIAMGTVLQDYLNPEFNLIGVESPEAAEQLRRLYFTVNGAECIETDITTAEGIKLSYNTWVTAKTVIANTWGELAYKTGMDFDAIRKSWLLSGRRILSGAYTDAGMGDGGGCHPRDNIAMSWLAGKVGMSHNLWDDLMSAREDTERWHAQVAMETARFHQMPLILLGKSFKPETNIETGSAALLLSNILDAEDFEHWHHEDFDPRGRVAVYFISTKNERYNDYTFAPGSVIIDPFGYIVDRPGVYINRLGRPNA